MKNEIDIQKLIVYLVKKWKIFLTITICFILASYIYTNTSPKLYKAQITFFVKQEKNSKVSNLTSFIGMGNDSNLNSFIHNILESYLIKKNIAKSLKDHYQEEINELIRNNKLSNSEKDIERFIISKLNFKKHFTFTVNEHNLFTLNYLNEKANITKLVLLETINQISNNNIIYDISLNKEVIKVIDTPVLPSKYYKPNLKKNILLSLLSALFVSILIITFKDYYLNQSNNDSN